MSKVDIKIVLLGMHNVGKTCLVERYLHDKFKENVTAVIENKNNIKKKENTDQKNNFFFHIKTVGAAFGAKKITSNGVPITLGIWVSHFKTN